MKTVPLRFKHCKVCNGLFIPTHNSNTVCSEECLKIASHNRWKEYEQRKWKKKWDEKVERSRKAIMDCASEGEKLGLSYGQYVALKHES